MGLGRSFILGMINGQKCNIPIEVDIYIGNLENSITSKNDFGKCQALRISMNPIDFVKLVWNNIKRPSIMIFIFFYLFQTEKSGIHL